MSPGSDMSGQRVDVMISENLHSLTLIIKAFTLTVFSSVSLSRKSKSWISSSEVGNGSCLVKDGRKTRGHHVTGTIQMFPGVL